MLFQEHTDTGGHKPLAERIRPTEFGELFGQESIWTNNSPLRRLVESGSFTSLIFWGPPGSGKTTLSRMIARFCKTSVVELSAVHAGVKEIREHLQKSQVRISNGHSASFMFMDEIHRLSKNQQDVLLPALETGTIKFIGATTENPSFEVNRAINSRSLIFRFEKLNTSAISTILKRALKLDYSSEEENQSISGNKTLSDEALEAIALSASGDARKALNLLEAVIAAYKNQNEVSLDDIKRLGDCLALSYDKNSDQHFDLISALIKSIRASHPDAAIYYLARMLAAGEDPNYIARRLLIAASEDIGNANPTALLIATNGVHAAQILGMPEIRITLAQVVTYLAASPKSNRSYVAIEKALEDVKKFGDLNIPFSLRNASTEYMKTIGYGKEYFSPHVDFDKAKTMKYLPDTLTGTVYYHPKDTGVEGQLKQNLTRLRPTKD